MSLTPLAGILDGDPAVGRLLDLAAVADRREPVVDVTVAEGARPALLASLSEVVAGARPHGATDSDRPHPVLLAVTATTRAAEDLVDALRCYLPAERVADFPSWETLPHERLSPRSDTVGRRGLTARVRPTP